MLKIREEYFNIKQIHILGFVIIQFIIWITLKQYTDVMIFLYSVMIAAVIVFISNRSDYIGLDSAGIILNSKYLGPLSNEPDKIYYKRNRGKTRIMWSEIKEMKIKKSEDYSFVPKGIIIKKKDGKIFAKRMTDEMIKKFRSELKSLNVSLQLKQEI